MTSRTTDACRLSICNILQYIGAILLIIFSIIIISALYRLRLPKDPEVLWQVRVQRCLAGVRDALMCYENINGVMPANKGNLYQSGCVMPGTTYESSRVGVVSLPISKNPDWYRLDQVVIRKQTDDLLLPETIIVVALPDIRYPNTYYVLQRDYTMRIISKNTSSKNNNLVEQLIGDADLRPP